MSRANVDPEMVFGQAKTPIGHHQQASRLATIHLTAKQLLAMAYEPTHCMQVDMTRDLPVETRTLQVIQSQIAEGPTHLACAVSVSLLALGVVEQLTENNLSAQEAQVMSPESYSRVTDHMVVTYSVAHS